MHSLIQRIEHWLLDKLIPFVGNPRTHSDAQIAQIAASIAEFGFNNPILVDTSDGIIAGHGRLLAARKLGLTEVPVIVLDHLTEAQKRAYLIADNQLALNAGWDDELLRAELAALQEEDFNLDVMGFSPHDLDALLALDDEEAVNTAPPLPETPVSRLGDLWVCGKHRVLCGDATKADAVARLLGDRKPRLMVCDPPYGIELDSEWRDRAGVNKHGPAEASYMKKRTAGHTETTISGDTRADWSDAFALVPSLEVAYVWHASKFTREVLDGLLRIGFVHHQQIIWDKGRTVLTRTLYWFQHEPCWFVRKVNAPWYGKAGENSTIWASPSPKFIMGGSDEDKYDHPTQKPVELMRRPILNHLRRHELVYEPFLGSGTTLAAAEVTERICFGIELDPKYVDVVVQRWQKLAGKKATLDNDGRTFEGAVGGKRADPPASAARTRSSASIDVGREMLLVRRTLESRPRQALHLRAAIWREGALSVNPEFQGRQWELSGLSGNLAGKPPGVSEVLGHPPIQEDDQYADDGRVREASTSRERANPRADGLWRHHA